MSGSRDPIRIPVVFELHPGGEGRETECKLSLGGLAVWSAYETQIPEDVRELLGVLVGSYAERVRCQAEALRS